jgi:hypothetical protein
MKYLVYKEASGRRLNKYKIEIKDNPAEIFNFAVRVLGSYFGNEYDEMNSENAMIVAQSFVDHYGGFSIE